MSPALPSLPMPDEAFAQGKFINRFIAGKALGTVSGTVTVQPGFAGVTLTANGPTVLTMPQPDFEMQFFEVCILAGGKGVTFAFPGAAVADDARWPKGQPTLDDFDLVTFQVLGGIWRGFGTGTPPIPDTTPPSAPTIAVASFTDTTVTLAVTRGTDAESAPTLMVRAYPSGATTKPAFAAMSPSNGQLVITGLSQLTTYVIEAQEVSKGGASAMSSVTQKTAMTHGWVVADTVTFDGADGTAIQGLTSAANQTITSNITDAQLVGNRGKVVTAGKSANIVLPATSNLPKARASADYAVPLAAGRNATFRLSIQGGYPLGAIGFWVDGTGAVGLDNGSNATWGAITPVAGASLTGQPTSGTMTVDYDQAAQTVTLSINGVQVATATVTSTPAAISAATGVRVSLNNYGGDSSTVDNLTVSKFQ